MQNFLGQRLVQPFANNGDFVINALDNLAGSADLIGLRSRATYTRPFTTVDKLRRDADAKFRETETELQAQLSDTEKKLGDLQAGRNDKSSTLMNSAQQEEIQRFLGEQVRIRQQLRSVRHELDQDINNLGTALKVINILVMPIVLIGVLLLVAALAPKEGGAMSRNGLIALAVALVVLGALAFFGQRGRSTAPTAGGPIMPGPRGRAQRRRARSSHEGGRRDGRDDREARRRLDRRGEGRLCGRRREAAPEPARARRGEDPRDEDREPRVLRQARRARHRERQGDRPRRGDLGARQGLRHR